MKDKAVVWLGSVVVAIVLLMVVLVVLSIHQSEQEAQSMKKYGKELDVTIIDKVVEKENQAIGKSYKIRENYVLILYAETEKYELTVDKDYYDKVEITGKLRIKEHEGRITLAD